MQNLGANVFAVLLAGGSGTRLWPVSRKSFPKQLAKLVDENSLIQNTIKRLQPVVADKRFVVVCGSRHMDGIARQMQALDIDPADKIIGEPCGRNTAPAILMAALRVLTIHPEAVCCVFPADHVIGDEDLFRKKLAQAVDLAQKGHIVTFGIMPHYPETGYGYIEGSQKVEDFARKVARFVEKPDLKTAKGYVKKGNFFWNSGMFVFKAAVMAQEFKSFEPEMLAQIKAMVSDHGAIAYNDYAAVENISIDYAIMENTTKGVVLPVDFKWSDIGSWKSLYDFFEKDADNNVIQGNVVSQNVKNSLIMADERLVAANRLDGVVIVETADAVFVSDLITSREVKGIVEELKQKQSKEVERHNTTQHTWGRLTDLESTASHMVHRLVVDPQATLEFDLASEGGANLTVVSGRGQITTGMTKKTLTCAGSMALLSGSKVCVENRGQKPLTLVRVICRGQD
jgi:mannose-1-phosphate guanylyltransferase/mannose-6-phosphate isomerase